MTALVDTSVLIDVLRGVPAARELLRTEMRVERLCASEITRLEVLAGMRESDRRETEALLGTITWSPVDERVATT